MIPKSQYLKNEDGPSYVTFKLLEAFHTDKEVNQFCGFMSGQTMMMANDGSAMIYAHDYERWLKKSKPDENDGWD